MKPTSSLLISLLAAVIAAAPVIVAGAARGDPGDPGMDDKTLVAKGTAPSNDEYRIGPGDKLRIEVYKDTQLSQSVQVRPDGKITLPLIGDLDATGQTPIELRDTVTRSLKDYVNNPTVTVIVVEALASQVFVMGEVTRPGTMQLHGPTTILQALAMAGGFKEFANTKDVKVLRHNGKGVETIKFNYKDVIKGDAQPFYLKAGDTVIVP